MCRYLVIEHRTYSSDKNICYILDKDEDGDLIFFLTKYIIYINEKYYLCGKVALLIIYDKKLHAYEIDIKEEWFIMLPSEFINTYKHRHFLYDNKLYAFSLFNII